MFDDEFFDLFDGLWNRFNRPVLDQRPYKAYEVEGKGFIIVCNTLGIAKENITVRIEKEKGSAYPILKIKGATNLDKINFKNSIDLGIKLKLGCDINSVNYEVKDGLTIIYLETKQAEKDKIEATYIDDCGKALDW